MDSRLLMCNEKASIRIRYGLQWKFEKVLEGQEKVVLCRVYKEHLIMEKNWKNIEKQKRLIAKVIAHLEVHG